MVFVKWVFLFEDFCELGGEWLLVFYDNMCNFWCVFSSDSLICEMGFSF